MRNNPVNNTASGILAWMQTICLSPTALNGSRGCLTLKSGAKGETIQEWMIDPTQISEDELSTTAQVIYMTAEQEAEGSAQTTTFSVYAYRDQEKAHCAKKSFIVRVEMMTDPIGDFGAPNSGLAQTQKHLEAMMRLFVTVIPTVLQASVRTAELSSQRLQQSEETALENMRLLKELIGAKDERETARQLSIFREQRKEKYMDKLVDLGLPAAMTALQKWIDPPEEEKKSDEKPNGEVKN